MVKDLVEFTDFLKLDLRVGKVTEAEMVAGSTKLIRLQVNLGTEYGSKQIISGIAKWYKPEELVGNNYVFAANLAPKQIMGQESNGMILCADNDGIAVLIPIDKQLPEGTVVR